MHFNDETSENIIRNIYKIKRIINILLMRFQNVYQLRKYIVVDKDLMLSVYSRGNPRPPLESRRPHCEVSRCYTGYLLTDRQSGPKVDSYEGRCIQRIDIERKNRDSPPLSGINC